MASTIHLRANGEKQNGFPFRFGYEEQILLINEAAGSLRDPCRFEISCFNSSDFMPGKEHVLLLQCC